jgi:hypothetical protein
MRPSFAPLLLAAVFGLAAPALLRAQTFDQLLDARWAASYNQIAEEIKTPELKKPDNSDPRFIWASHKGPVDVILNRTRALLEDIAAMPGAPDLAIEGEQLATLRDGATGKSTDLAYFKQIAALRRRISMKNPLLNFDSMVFTCFESGKPQFHSQQMAFFALNDPGAGLYQVSGFKQGNPAFKDLLNGPVVQNGRFAGKSLSNKFAEWKGRAGFFTPELSYDGTKIMFAWAPWAAATNWTEGKYTLKKKFRIFEMGLDGSNLRMLTDFLTPEMDEYDPLYLPNGRILFVSERHNGGQRCGNTATSGNMYSMNPDGSDLVRITWHETNERSPTVDWDGRIVYSRWDYIDRHAYSAQSMWLCYPDGRDPRSWHGNYIEDDKPFHPIAECDIRPIPGKPGKYVGIAAGHHDAYEGNLCVIDITKRAKYEEQIRWFWEGWSLPGDNFLATSNRFDRRGRRFSTPFPLSEDYVIVAEYDEVLLVDKFRNEVLLFSNKPFCSINISSPLPVRSRPVEPALATKTYQGARRAGAPKATISVMNVYETDTPLPPGTVITQLRINQILGRPKKPWDTLRNIWQAWSDGGLLKAAIGTVPVEPDGSAYFEAPIEREIYFQLLDEKGMAVTSMLSGTYVHPGEHLSCIGCHEDKWKTWTPTVVPLALRRPPSKITPEPDGSYPLNFHRLVRIPVFDKHCLPCHQERNVALKFEYWDRTKPYENGSGIQGPSPGLLSRYVKYYNAAYKAGYGYDNQIHMGFPGTTQSRSVPLQMGAHGSLLKNFLEPSHYGVALTTEEKRRVTLWMDLNCQELGIYEYDSTNPGQFNNFDNTLYSRQRAGEVVWPTWEHSGMDPNNPTGVQLD